MAITTEDRVKEAAIFIAQTINPKLPHDSQISPDKITSIIIGELNRPEEEVIKRATAKLTYLERKALGVV